MDNSKAGIKADEFIANAWLFLAPYAYGRFLEVGRGAVRIDISKVKITRRDDNYFDVQGPIKYLDIDSDEVLMIGNDDLDDRLEEYDPELQVCFLFVEPVETSAKQHLVLTGAPSGQPTPRDIYNAQAALRQ